MKTSQKTPLFVFISGIRPILVLLVSLLFLTACGFQLRGAADLPPEMDSTHLAIENEYSDLARRLDGFAHPKRCQPCWA